LVGRLEDGWTDGCVAQLVEASDLKSLKCGFESRRVYFQHFRSLNKRGEKKEKNKSPNYCRSLDKPLINK
jgi:hypothetical protein